MNDNHVAAGEYPASEDPRTQGPGYLYTKNQLHEIKCKHRQYLLYESLKGSKAYCTTTVKVFHNMHKLCREE